MSAGLSRPDQPVIDARLHGFLRADFDAWMGGLVRGDDGAWGEFHDVFAPRLFRYLLVILGGHEANAEDALQQAFVRAVRHVRPMPSQADLWRWLTCVARNVARDLRKREARQGGLLARWGREARAEPAEPDTDTAWEAALEGALSDLSPQDRGLIQRKYFEKQPVQAIALELSASEKAIESRLGRARARLREGILSRLRDYETQ